MTCACCREAARRREHRLDLELALREGLSLAEAHERRRSYAAHRPRLEAQSPPAAQPMRADADPELTAPIERRKYWWED